MKTLKILNPLLTSLFLLIVSSSSAQAAKAPSEEKLLAALFAKSEKLTVVHQVTGQKTTFANLMAETLLTTHLTLTPSFECPEADQGKTSCILHLSAEGVKTNTAQVMDEDESDMFYMISFSYTVDSAGKINITGNKMSYRIVQ